MAKKLRLAAGLCLLAWLAWKANWDQVAEALGQLRWPLWLLGVGLYALTQMVSSVRWQLLARPLGIRRPLRHLIAFYYIGMFFNLVLPTSVGGDVVRAWYLDGNSGQRLSAFLSVLLDRLSGLLILVLLACGAMVFCPVEVPLWLTVSVWSTAVALTLGLSALPLLARFPLLSARHQLLTVQLRQCLPLLLHPAPLLLSVIVQCANVILVWMIGQALGISVVDGWYWILVPVVTLLTLLPISVNGMGVREGGTVLLLSLQGVGSGMALSLALLWFAVFTVVSLAGAPLYLFGSFPRFEVSSDDQPFDHRSDQGRVREHSAAA